MEQSAHPRPQGTTRRDPMVTRWWWLRSLGGDAAGTLAAVAGWPLATRPDAAVARKEGAKGWRRHPWLRGVVARSEARQRGAADGWAPVAYARAVLGGRLKRRVAACR